MPLLQPFRCWPWFGCRVSQRDRDTTILRVGNRVYEMHIEPRGSGGPPYYLADITSIEVVEPGDGGPLNDLDRWLVIGTLCRSARMDGLASAAKPGDLALAPAGNPVEVLPRHFGSGLARVEVLEGAVLRATIDKWSLVASVSCADESEEFSLHIGQAKFDGPRAARIETEFSRRRLIGLCCEFLAGHRPFAVVVKYK